MRLKIALELSQHLRSVLESQGRLVARRPLPFLVIPLLLSTLLSYGFIFLRSLTEKQDALQLYIPQRGLSQAAKERIESEFGNTYQAELDPINGVTFSIILRHKDGSDILNQEFVTEYLWLRKRMESLRVYATDDEGFFTYSAICWRAISHQCAPDFFSLLTARGIQGYRDIRLLTFPTAVINDPNASYPLRIRVPLGGVRLVDESGSFIRTANSAMMNFHFPFNYPGLVYQWEEQFKAVLETYTSVHGIEISWFTMGQFQEDLDSIALNLQNLMPFLGMVIITFCIGSCCVADWVHSKPLLAFGGVVSAMAAVISGFGLLLLFQVQMVDIVYISPFLILSIGVDDMFLMVAAWRRTGVCMDLQTRMGETFADAAVSISITSITDILSFLIGAFSVFPAVRYFCIYTAVCLVFTFLYQITLFGAMMAYSGWREENNRHCFLFIKLKNSQEARKEINRRGFWWRVLCTGGDGRLAECICAPPERSPAANVNVNADGATPLPLPTRISPKDNMFNLFFQRYYAPFLSHKSVQIAAGFSYLAYLAMAIMGTMTVQVGMNYAQLLPDSVVSSEFFEWIRHDFYHYTPPLEVLLPQDINWESDDVQRAALGLAASLQNTRFTRDSRFWLQDYLPFAAARKTANPSVIDFYTLLGEFLRQPEYLEYVTHIIFNERYRIRSSRFLVEVVGIRYGEEKDFLDTAAVLPSTFQTVAAATGAMLLVSFLLIPKPACSLCLAACIISTNFGVLGAMSLWGVRLDIVSMITVLMSIGISVDFVAHISFFYVQALELQLPVSTAQRALRYLGLPIMQGAISTICGMLVLLAIPAYMIRAFVKTMLLVIVFGLYHGLVLLPITLSLFINNNNPGGRRPPKPINKAFKGSSILGSTSQLSVCPAHPTLGGGNQNYHPVVRRGGGSCGGGSPTNATICTSVAGSSTAAGGGGGIINSTTPTTIIPTKLSQVVSSKNRNQISKNKEPPTTPIESSSSGIGNSNSASFDSAASSSTNHTQNSGGEDVDLQVSSTTNNGSGVILSSTTMNIQPSYKLGIPRDSLQSRSRRISPRRTVLQHNSNTVGHRRAAAAGEMSKTMIYSTTTPNTSNNKRNQLQKNNQQKNRQSPSFFADIENNKFISDDRKRTSATTPRKPNNNNNNDNSSSSTILPTVVSLLPNPNGELSMAAALSSSTQGKPPTLSSHIDSQLLPPITHNQHHSLIITKNNRSRPNDSNDKYILPQSSSDQNHQNQRYHNKRKSLQPTSSVNPPPKTGFYSFVDQSTVPPNDFNFSDNNNTENDHYYYSNAVQKAEKRPKNDDQPPKTDHHHKNISSTTKRRSKVNNNNGNQQQATYLSPNSQILKQQSKNQHQIIPHDAIGGRHPSHVPSKTSVKKTEDRGGGGGYWSSKFFQPSSKRRFDNSVVVVPPSSQNQLINVVSSSTNKRRQRRENGTQKSSNTMTSNNNNKTKLRQHGQGRTGDNYQHYGPTTIWTTGTSQTTTGKRSNNSRHPHPSSHPEYPNGNAVKPNMSSTIITANNNDTPRPFIDPDRSAKVLNWLLKNPGPTSSSPASPAYRSDEIPTFEHDNDHRIASLV